MQHRPRHREGENMKTENDKLNRREKEPTGRRIEEGLKNPERRINTKNI